MDRGVPTLGERRDVTRDDSHPLCRTQLRPAAWLRRESPVKILPAELPCSFPAQHFHRVRFWVQPLGDAFHLKAVLWHTGSIEGVPTPHGVEPLISVAVDARTIP